MGNLRDMGTKKSFQCILMLLLYISVQSCPPAENLAPLCTCKDFFQSNMMLCKGILSPEELIAPMRGVSSSNIRIFSLSISESSLMYIPHRIFQGTGIEKIRFESSEVMSLSDTDSAFVGLEDTLTEIRATDAHYIAQWDWQQLRNLKRLELIDINWISMQSIDEAFPELPELSHLGIIRAEISFIVDNAFTKLEKLKILIMKENDISELKRSMLPDPADSLIIMDFSDNELENLPEDFFRNMPSLLEVHLNRNKFFTLAEKPFSSLFQICQEVRMAGNPFRCDCRMRWLVGSRTPFYFTATCSSPESLNGVSLENLDLKSILC